MRRVVVIALFVGLALAIAVVALTTGNRASVQRASAESRAMPIVVRCPRAEDFNDRGGGRIGWFGATADQVLAVARRVNHREVTHYQGRAERRTRLNTPLQGLVLNVGDDSLNVPGRQALAALAKQRCGNLGLATSAVTFADAISPMCCQTFTLFVAMGSRTWVVFKA
jgi:hypothetical protein